MFANPTLTVLVLQTVVLLPLSGEMLFAQANDKPSQAATNPDHDSVLAKLTAVEGVVHNVHRDDQGNIVLLRIPERLPAELIEQVNRIDTLATLQLLPPVLTRAVVPKPIYEPLEDDKFVLSEFNRHESLTSLALGDVSVDEWSVLPLLRNLESLTFKANPELDTSALSGLLKLRSLNVTGMIDDPSVAMIKNMNQLEKLSLPENVDNRAIPNLADKAKLNTLYSRGLSFGKLVQSLVDEGRILSDAIRLAGHNNRVDPKTGEIVDLSFNYNANVFDESAGPVFDQLVDLQVLNCGWSQLTNEQFVRFFGDKPLTELRVNGSGCTPAILESLNKISTLRDLSVNFLDSDTPFPSLSDLKNLESLQLSMRNAAHEIDTLDLPASLKKLNLAWLPFTEKSGEQLSKLTELQELRLYNMPATTRSLAGLEKLTHLKKVSFTKTEVDDGIFKMLSQLSHIKEFEAQHSDVSVDGEFQYLREHLGVTDLQLLSRIGVLVKRDERNVINEIKVRSLGGGSSEVARMICGFPHVELLEFYQTEITPGWPALFAENDSIKRIEFRLCPTLTGEMLAELKGMTTLRELEVAYRKGITAEDADVFAGFKQLELLHLRAHHFDDVTIERIKKSLPNCVVKH